MRKPIASCASLLLALLLVPAPSQARWMSPDAGRFQTMDSYEGTQEEPLTLHKYLYAHADPVNGTDPSGHFISIDVGTGKTYEMEMRKADATAASIAYANMSRSMVFKIGAWAIIGGAVAGNVAMVADVLLPAPQQQSFERYKNKYSGVQYACVRYATEFKRENHRATFVAFRINESEPDRAPFNAILARSGSLFDKGQDQVIRLGFHVGAVLNNLVFDNNILGVPLPLWGENYYMAKSPDVWSEYNMNEAVRMGFGEMRLYTNEADVPHSRHNFDGKWNRGVSVAY
jgi:hypothetical protein